MDAAWRQSAWARVEVFLTMASDSFRFGPFLLHCRGRRLCGNGAAVDLNSRYLDALILLVREAGELVSKDRFLEEIWRGVPVTDEALTQCIKTLRKALGDSAAEPRFIETVPKHGYRFIAAVEAVQADSPGASGAVRHPWRNVVLPGGAGTLGAGLAGLVGGLFYGLAAAVAHPAMGALSVLLVLMAVTMTVALLGGAGVAFGIAAARAWRGPSPWSIAGGAAGGLLVGALVKLVGQDAFRFLLGHSPGDFTGALEGAALGAGVGLGFWLGAHGRRWLAAAGLAGAVTGLAISLPGGRLMGGSLDLLARNFPDSTLSLDAIGGMLGESGFGPLAQAVTASLEGALFAVCIVGAMRLAARRRP
jgi:DNA-binding winged helix-turn-helix (wHTH) protein